jgi:uncharacterized membrane protein YphA (DoxX/SURF4 family)
MNIALWIVQGLLAVAFLMAGGMKAMKPKSEIEEKMAWAKDFSANQLKTIGILEVLGALGLILPAATGIVPILTPIAAVGLALTMIGAVITHLRRKDPMAETMPSAVLLLLSLFVVYGRFVAAPL